jgi:hypothetical protein
MLTLSFRFITYHMVQTNICNSPPKILIHTLLKHALALKVNEPNEN